MNQIKVSFFGLCYVRVPKDESLREVYLLSTKELPHIATLAVRVEDLDLSAKDARDPTLIVHDGDTQIACFQIPASQTGVTTLVMSGDKEPKPWTKSDRDDSVNFYGHHEGFDTKDFDDLKPLLTARVVLEGGRFDSRDIDSEARLYAEKDPKHPKQTGIARSIDWFPGKKLEIEFKEDGGTDRVVLKDRAFFSDRTASITNVSIEHPDMHKTDPNHGDVLNAHFHLYYELLRPDVTVKDGDKLKLVKGHDHVSGKGPAATRTEEAYDCVPPGTGS